MNTATSQIQPIHHTVKEALSGLVSPYDVTPQNIIQELEVPVHHGKSVNYYLGVYTVIFSGIMVLVMVVEEFFFKY